MKFMICGTVLDLLQSSGKIPCTVCCTGVGSNSIFCIICKHRVHKKCSGLKHLTKDPDLKCTWCQGTAHPFDSRPQGEVQVGPDKCENCLEEVQGAATSSLPATSLSRHVATCTALVYGAQCSMPVRRPLSKPNLQYLQWNDRAMIRQICNVKPQDIVTTRSSELLAWLGTEALRIWTSF